MGVPRSDAFSSLLISSVVLRDLKSLYVDVVEKLALDYVVT